MHTISFNLLLLVGVVVSYIHTDVNPSESETIIQEIPTPNKDSEAIIREARAASNRAIAAKDTAAISRLWTEDFHMISSRNAEVTGRKANQLNFAKEFKNRPDILYVRTPLKIEVNEAWNMASEQGQWVGTWTDGRDKITVQGSYFAKWHRLNGQWLIRAELYVPLQCKGGAFCATSPL